MSIQLRLTLALGLVLSLSLFAMIAALLLDAGPRLQSEIASGMRIAESVVRSSVGPIEEASRPQEILARLVEGLQHQRHVRVSLESGSTDVRTSDAGLSPDSNVPSWLALQTVEPVRVPVHSQGKVIGAVIVAPAGYDEMQEVWDTIGRIAGYGLLFSIGAFLVTSLLVRRAIAPIYDLDRAMHLLEAGDYDVEVARQGPPEIAAICTRLNRLAAALERSRNENRQLSVGVIRIQDSERREVARELHDELGPHLFSIRANGGMLRGALDRDPPQIESALRKTAAILDAAEALQQTNRRVLQRLSPVGLRELGLAGAIRALVTSWRKEMPDIAVHLDIDQHIDGFDDTTGLTIYRVVQEGLTNAFRHAGATRIAVFVERVSRASEHEQADQRVSIRIEDNGEGLPDEMAEGYGLKGMRERVGLLGGTLSISRNGERGTQVVAIVSALAEQDCGR
ncbi:MAG: ATP-binding protein [Hyphomicrobium sp.]